MAEPIRIAQVMGYMNGGGVEQVVMNYYRHIDRSRIQFDFIVCEGSTLVPEREIAEMGGQVFVVPPYQRLFDYQRELGILFREMGWTIVHSHVNSLSVFPLRAAKKAGISIRIAHSHNTSGRGEFAKNLVKSVLRTQANRYPTHRLACSCVAGKWLFGHKEAFEVVPNAIDLDGFLFDRGVQADTRAELGLPADCFALLHVGRFCTQKNHGFLLDVFARIVEIRPESILLLAGTGDLLYSVEARARELGLLGKIRFLGQRDDVRHLYMAADAFVLPSLYEGFGIAAIEAQVSGLPCFLSTEVTREVDITGTCRFLPLGDPIVWADEIARCDSTSRTFPNPKLLEEYDINCAATKLARRYESMLSNGCL